MIALPGLIVAALTASSPLQLHFTPGATYSQIFSICISFSLDGQKEQTVARNSGSATYVVNTVSGNVATVRTPGQYDGRVTFDGSFTQDLSTYNVRKDGKQVIDTDGSGFLYNPFIWGDAPASLVVGTTWNSSIPTSWELGPAGAQKVTVLAVDPQANSITLERDGSGSGTALADHEFAFTYDGTKTNGTVAPDGPTIWSGISTFTGRVVTSDAILVTRSVVVTLASGMRVRAGERLYTLVGAVPADAS
jgi:hypothetical protein